jgi:hypothetical protein
MLALFSNRESLFLTELSYSRTEAAKIVAGTRPAFFKENSVKSRIMMTFSSRSTIFYLMW